MALLHIILNMYKSMECYMLLKLACVLSSDTVMFIMISDLHNLPSTTRDQWAGVLVYFIGVPFLHISNGGWKQLGTE